MACYRFNFQTDGEVVQEVTRELADDLDALDVARQLSEACEVEVWQGEIFIARVKRGNEPLTVDDSKSG